MSNLPKVAYLTMLKKKKPGSVLLEPNSSLFPFALLDLMSETLCIAVNEKRAIFFFFSCLNCAMKYTYDVSLKDHFSS